MRKPVFKFLIPIVTVLLVALGIVLAHSRTDKEAVAARAMLQALENWHYNQIRLNDAFSQRAFHLFMKRLDPNKRFFLESDIEQLKQYRDKIDDELEAGSYDLLDEASALLKKRILKAQSFYQEILKKPFDFTKDEKLETDPEKRDYCSDEAEQRELWRKLLKQKALLYYLDLYDQEKTKPEADAGTPVFRGELEEKAREKLLVSLKREFQMLLSESDDDRLGQYLNAIAGSFDPHTEYFLPEQLEEFEMDLSGTLEGIGAILESGGEYVKVNEIVPGSAAWRQNELKAGDLIMKVGQGAEEPVDISYMPLNDVVKLIRGKKGTEVRLTVKKPDGRILVISIIRDIVVNEEAYAKSAVIINRQLEKKFGYIYLPSFYHDYKSGKGRNAARDVRHELEKLKAQKVDGVILDLRNNGGGILEDAIAISGLFIKNGPMLQVRDSTGRIEVLNDPDPGIVYSGPLAVLVNSFSASASEILAAALQDYNRAIIIGGPSSFGKGTVQVITDLDRLLDREFSILKPVGSLKLTSYKYYRVTGVSTQGAGVVSDIPLPDIYEALAKEKDLDYALPWDAISAVFFKKWPYQQYNLKELRLKSAQRVKANSSFQIISDHVKRIKEQQENTYRSLQLSKVYAEQKTLRQAADRLKNLGAERSYLQVTALNGDSGKDPARWEKVKEWQKQVGSDPYIDEAMYVLGDVINQSIGNAGKAGFLRKAN